MQFMGRMGRGAGGRQSLLGVHKGLLGPVIRPGPAAPRKVTEEGAPRRERLGRHLQKVGTAQGVGWKGCGRASPLSPRAKVTKRGQQEEVAIPGGLHGQAPSAEGGEQEAAEPHEWPRQREGGLSPQTPGLGRNVLTSDTGKCSLRGQSAVFPPNAQSGRHTHHTACSLSCDGHPPPPQETGPGTGRPADNFHETQGPRMREEKEDPKPEGRHRDGLPGSPPAAMANTQGLRSGRSVTGKKQHNTFLSPVAHRSVGACRKTLVCRRRHIGTEVRPEKSQPQQSQVPGELGTGREKFTSRQNVT